MARLPQKVNPQTLDVVSSSDENHSPLWSGGALVRTDGNNFIAELAAAAIVAKACPRNLPILIRIDSMATIGAISKGPVSERKRIRAAGRAWLNFSRSEFSQIGRTIMVEHVRSHTGSQTVEQVGNNNADQLAAFSFQIFAIRSFSKFFKYERGSPWTFLPRC